MKKAMPPAKRSKAQQSRIEVKDAIRKAAITEFSQHGFAGASTQAIAERAGLSKSTLHYYIEDKEALYAEVLGELMEIWKRLFEFDEKSAKPGEVLAHYIRQKLTFSFEHPELSRIFTSEVLSGGHRLSRFWPDAVANTNLKVATIEGWVKSGAIRTLDARLLIMHVWAMTQYYADYAIQVEKMLDTSLKTPRTQNRILDELVAFVLAGCGLTPASK